MKGHPLKRTILTLAAVLALAFGGGTVAGASGQAGQCAGYNDPSNVKIDTSDDDLVLPAGLTVCIHASNENTGQFTTDGILTLGQYIVEFGLLNNGGQTPGVSNYVIYGGPQPSNPTSTSTPTVGPSATPTPTSTTTPSPSPVPTLTPSAQPSSGPTPSAPTITPTPSSPVLRPTMPATDVSQSVGDELATGPDNGLFLFGTLVILILLLLGTRNDETNYRIDR